MRRVLLILCILLVLACSGLWMWNFFATPYVRMQSTHTGTLVEAASFHHAIGLHFRFESGMASGVEFELLPKDIADIIDQTSFPRRFAGFGVHVANSGVTARIPLYFPILVLALLATFLYKRGRRHPSAAGFEVRSNPASAPL